MISRRRVPSRASRAGLARAQGARARGAPANRAGTGTSWSSSRVSSRRSLPSAGARGTEGSPAEIRAVRRPLREALELWRGQPLADFAYDEFAQAEIARLEELRLERARGAVRRRARARPARRRRRGAGSARRHASAARAAARPADARPLSKRPAGGSPARLRGCPAAVGRGARPRAERESATDSTRPCLPTTRHWRRRRACHLRPTYRAALARRCRCSPVAAGCCSAPAVPCCSLRRSWWRFSLRHEIEPLQGSSQPGPNSLVAIDPKTNRVVAKIRLAQDRRASPSLEGTSGLRISTTTRSRASTRRSGVS